ncbi:MAG: hypothetical protein KAJ75_04040 [Alphaproteobacteria bacterium]|nr:hypothetical protein [Alphaproteobacteria bacterium]
MSKREKQPNIPNMELDMHGEPKHWLARKSSIYHMKRIAYIVLATLILCDFLIHGHSYFGIDGTFGFYSWFGLIAGIAMILLSKTKAFIIKREDNYYDDK